MQLDNNGVVKLFEAEAADQQEQCVSTIGSPSLFASESTSENLTHSQVVSQVEIDRICGSYQRPDITLYDRLQIATCFWDSERPWGTVAWLAQKYGTSRQTIYQIAYQAQRGLSAGRPGPKDKPPQIETSSTDQAEFHLLMCRKILHVHVSS